MDTSVFTQSKDSSLHKHPKWNILASSVTYTLYHKCELAVPRTAAEKWMRFKLCCHRNAEEAGFVVVMEAPHRGLVIHM